MATAKKVTLAPAKKATIAKPAPALKPIRTALNKSTLAAHLAD